LLGALWLLVLAPGAWLPLFFEASWKDLPGFKKTEKAKTGGRALKNSGTA